MNEPTVKTHLPVANRIYSSKEAVSSTGLEIASARPTLKEEKRDEASMSFRWYCPDQVLTVISQNEACAFGEPNAQNLEHPSCALHKTKIHLPSTSPYGCQITAFFTVSP
jgi:hypothetical protein